MKNIVRIRLQSNTGASLSMALLLFLVCTVLTSVILTAATATSGRVSELAEMDQKYYSVTSAAELVAKELCGKPVSITRNKTTMKTTVKTYSENLNGKLTLSGTPTETTQTRYDTFVGPEENPVRLGGGAGASVLLTDLSFLTGRAVWLLFGGEDGSVTVNSDDAWGRSISKDGHAQTNTEFYIVPSETGATNSANGSLLVKCTYRMNSDGTLVFAFESGEGGTESYRFNLTLAANYEESESDPQVETTQSFAGNRLTEATTTTLTKTATVTWQLQSVG